MNQNLGITVDALEIKASGNRRESHPTGFKDITLYVEISAENLTTDVLDNVIKTAEETLCPVYSMISNSTKINVEYKILQPFTASFCGVFCKSCPLYIGTKEDPSRLEYLSKRMEKSVDELKCSGCRSDENSYYCRDCSLKNVH